MEIVDGFGRTWTSDPAPPGAVHKVYGQDGNLISYMMEGPSLRAGENDDPVDEESWS